MSDSTIISRALEILATASSRVNRRSLARRAASQVASNIRFAAREHGVGYRALRVSSGVTRRSMLRLWFSGDASVIDIVRVQAALHVDIHTLWAIR